MDVGRVGGRGRLTMSVNVPAILRKTDRLVTHGNFFFFPPVTRSRYTASVLAVTLSHE